MTYGVRDWFREFGRWDLAQGVYIPEPPTGEELEAWTAWFAQYGVDVDDVVLTQWVERRANPGQNQIVFLEDGERDGVPIHQERIIDLPEPPARFPVP